MEKKYVAYMAALVFAVGSIAAYSHGVDAKRELRRAEFIASWPKCAQMFMAEEFPLIVGCKAGSGETVAFYPCGGDPKNLPAASLLETDFRCEDMAQPSDL